MAEMAPNNLRPTAHALTEALRASSGRVERRALAAGWPGADPLGSLATLAGFWVPVERHLANKRPLVPELDDGSWQRAELMLSVLAGEALDAATSLRWCPWAPLPQLRAEVLGCVWVLVMADSCLGAMILPRLTQVVPGVRGLDGPSGVDRLAPVIERAGAVSHVRRRMCDTAVDVCGRLERWLDDRGHLAATDDELATDARRAAGAGAPPA
ncbi:MAG: hypothetical protein S0880_27260 [Actinomycetota bacterium]|nr:hypothetical protein [Actinomycetota bacterium]